MTPTIRMGGTAQGPMIARRAVKAVVVREGRLLLVRSGARGDLKFPGGGVRPGESDLEALARELREECGRDLIEAGPPLLEVVETRPDSSAPGTDFQMVSTYFPCAIGARRRGQDLDDYEAALELTPTWAAPEEALRTNESLLAAGDTAAWVAREVLVLRWLIANGIRSQPGTQPVARRS